MTRYQYTAFTSQGQMTGGEIDAENEFDAAHQLRLQGLYPAGFQEYRARWWQQFFRFELKSAVPDEASLSQLAGQLATLLQSGIAIERALDVVMGQSAGKTRAKLDHIRQAVVSGKQLSEALSQEQLGFGPDALAMIEAGESTGATGDALKQISELLDYRVKFRSQILSALIYPSILVVMALISTAIVVGFLVPSLAPMFEGTGQEMPQVMRAILAVNSFLAAQWQFIVAALIAGVVVLMALMNSTSGKSMLEQMMLKLPLFGHLLLEFEAARFCITFSALSSSGSHILPALRNARNACKLAQSLMQLDKAITQVDAGTKLSQGLSKLDMLADSDVQLIEIGEETNRLGEMFAQIGAIKHRMATLKTERLMTLLPPAITISIGGFVALIIITVMQALISINNLAIG